MIGKVTITITETKAGIQREYQLGEGYVYEIARSWIAICGLPVPKKFSVFTFGGKQLFVTDDCMKRSIKAVPVSGWWLKLYLKYRFREIYTKLRRRFFQG
jgi:hypothetical protein